MEENNLNLSREELARLLEEAKRKTQEMLDKMTPEERARAEAEAQRRIAEDQASMQQLIDEAKRVAGPAPAAEKAPNFCRNCGAKAGGGKFCEYCGSKL